MPDARKIAGYGRKKDSKFDNDRCYQPKPDQLARLRSETDLRAFCPPPYDQGQIGSCTANALAAAYQMARKRAGSRDTFVPSRLFIYYNVRNLENALAGDDGAEIRDGLKSLQKQGVCPEALWPYRPMALREKPAEAAYETAKLYRIGEYKRIGPNEPVPEDPKKRNAQLGLNPAHVKAAVADGSPVILGIEIFPSFEAQLAVDSGFISVPHQAEIQGSPMSGHAVLVVGYRDALNSFLIRNSWGAGWGVGGYGWLPYQYVTPPLCLKTEPDCWTFILDEANEGSLSSALVK